MHVRLAPSALLLLHFLISTAALETSWHAAKVNRHCTQHFSHLVAPKLATALALDLTCNADNGVLQAEKKTFEADAKARATANSSSRYGQQEVCQISGLIINSEETRVRDHKMGRNYRCA